MAKKAMISVKDLAAIKKRAIKAESRHKKSLKSANKKGAALNKTDKAQAAAYIATIMVASSSIEDFATKTKSQTMSEDDVELLITAVQAKANERDKEKIALTTTNKSNPALADYASVEQKQNSWFEAAMAHSLAHRRSARVQKFVKFVVSKNIAPITSYAAENWPHKPEEFYAEAYSMYFTKPNDLKAASKKLFKWFKDKKY
ncbi:MAG: hypothetical protein L3J28_14195 [Candidatus Polarisedimenticolaceae bacterium]|nr:hypothetical protein [Candidatus Polarisedimenticolaceae bacterium]